MAPSKSRKGGINDAVKRTAGRAKSKSAARRAKKGAARSVNGAPSDNYQRMRAGCCLDESFLVEAGAGTGKTSLIMERLRNIICTRDVPMEGIVAITFTEKAAGELRSRLREELETLLVKADEKERVRVESALRGLDRAAISTIHSFCSSLLRERPVEAGVDPGFRVADEVLAEELLDSAWERWLHERMVPENSRLRLAFSTGVTLNAVRKLADALARRRDMLAWTPDSLPSSTPAEFVGRLREEMAALKRHMDLYLKDSKDKLALEASKVESFLNWCDRRLSIDGAAVGRGAKETMEAFSSAILQIKLRSKNRGNARKWSSKESLEQARATLSEIDGSIAGFRKALLHNAVVGLTEELKIFVEHYEAAKNDQGVLDFDDLLLDARNLLRDSREAREYFKAKFKVILIDEFQDTDPLQAEVAFFLAERAGEHSASWEEVELERGKLFLVGDPKQSIYRFRGADIEVYERSKRALERAGETLPVFVNFRSRPGVLDPINLTFEKIMLPPAEGDYQPKYVPLDAFREAGGPGLALLRPATELPGDAKADEKRAYEASAIAWSVREVVERGYWTVYEKRTGKSRPVGYGDIALLFWATTGLGIYEEALRTWEIPYRVAGGKAFYARAEIRALLSVLTAIENPHDGVAVIGALRSPFFGLADDEIFVHWSRAGSLNYTEVSMEGDVERAFGVLRSLREERNHLSLGCLLDRIFERTGVLPTLYMRPNGDQRVANLGKMSALASKLEETGPITFKRFLRWVERQDERAVEEGESPLQETGDDFVTVLTIHKAKGLEFPVVFLPDLTARERKGGELLVADRGKKDLQIKLSRGLGLETDGWETASKREEEILAAEKIRLLYVAMTRAREKLVIPHLFDAIGTAKGAAVKNESVADVTTEGASAGGGVAEGRLSYLGPILGPALSGECSWAEVLKIPEAGLERRNEKALRGAASSQSSKKADYIAGHLKWSRSLEDLVESRAVARAVVSPTGLLPALEFSESEVEGSEGVFFSDVGRRIGTLVHSVLDMEGGWDAGAMADLALSLGKELGLGPEATERAAQMLREFAASPFAGRIRAARRVRREVPFCVKMEATVEGTADLLMEEVDGWRVVDFKTDAVKGEQISKRAEHYRLQGACYALCLSKVIKRPIVEVIFYFLSPQQEHVFRVDKDMLDEAERAIAVNT